jgi:hypothetical protein
MIDKRISLIMSEKWIYANFFSKFVVDERKELGSGWDLNCSYSKLTRQENKEHT